MSHLPFHRAGSVTTVVLLGLALLLPACTSDSGEPTRPLPTPDQTLPKAGDDTETRSAVFAGGCFWCVEAVFEPLAGVEEVISGYAGGKAETATYEQVAAGRTDHAEVVKV
ncbi:MAG: peptide-methionine (S)-S-oxide reductase, partial [Phycisphaeraceae bacterium]|nr:peptide-methionine (S)-S-oxide reductase [Phycisphaeraceae bacterium]